jgi:hypothetical protein
LVGSELPGPDASPDPSPTAAAASPTDPASPSDQAVAVPSRSSYAAVPWILGGAGGVLAFGGIGVAVALWVRRGRIALPAPGSAVPGQSGLTVSSEPSDGP